MKFQKSAQDLLASQKSSIDFSSVGVKGIDYQFPQLGGGGPSNGGSSPNFSPNVLQGAGKANRFGTKMNIEQ